SELGFNTRVFHGHSNRHLDNIEPKGDAWHHIAPSPFPQRGRDSCRNPNSRPCSQRFAVIISQPSTKRRSCSRVPPCGKRLITHGQFIDHLTERVLPGLLDRLSSQTDISENERGRTAPRQLVERQS